jgi:hypothetical protein
MKPALSFVSVAAGVTGLVLCIVALAKSPPPDRRVSAPALRSRPSPAWERPTASDDLALAAVTRPPDVTPFEPPPVKVVKVHEDDRPDVRAGEKAPAPFASLPEGQAKVIDLAVEETLRASWAPAEVEDRLCDLLLSAAVSASGLGTKEATAALAARIAVSRAAPGAAPRALRACRLDGDRVLVLLPGGDEASRAGDLARLADELTWRHGRRGWQVVPVEYRLQEEQALATVTRRPPLAGADLFTAAYGYAEQEVGDEAGLRAFLERVDDVVFVKAERGRYVFGGRRLSGHAPCGLTPEQALANWQAEQKVAALQARAAERCRAVRAGLDRDCARLRSDYDEAWDRRRAALQRNENRTEFDVARFRDDADRAALRVEEEMRRLAAAAELRCGEEQNDLEAAAAAVWKDVPEEALRRWQLVAAPTR